MRTSLSLLSRIWRLNHNHLHNHLPLCQLFKHIPSLQTTIHVNTIQTRTYTPERRPVVIGGSNVDIVATATEDIQMDGRLLNGTIAQCQGGVGRNIANALARLQTNPLLITAVGDDELGQFLLSGSLHMDTRGFLHCSEYSSGCCCVIVDKHRECKFIVGNMNIHSQITMDWIQRFEQEIVSSSFLVLDGNLKKDSYNYVLKLCNSHNIPVWFEPTDIAVCDHILQSPEWSSITHTSPNFNELKRMTSVLTGKNYSNINPSSSHDLINESISLARNFPKKMTVMVTLGKHGMLFVCGDSIKYYEALPVQNISNVSGAGDCAVAGYITAHLSNMNESDKVSAALSCARQSLLSTTPVPFNVTLDVVNIKCRSIDHGS